MISYPERVKIQRSSIPKISKIHSCVWKLQVKALKTVNFGQKWPNFRLKWPKNFKSEFSRHIEYDFLKEDNKNNFHNKTKYDWFPGKSQNSKKFSIPKIRKIYSGVWKMQAKNTQKWLFWPNFDHFWPFWGSKNFSTKKFLVVI